MKRLILCLLAACFLLCGCESGSKKSDSKEEEKITATQPEEQPSADLSAFSYYRGTAGTASENDNVFLHPYQDGYVCLNYDFEGGCYDDIKGCVLTARQQEKFLALLEEGVTEAQSEDSDGEGNSDQQFYICLDGEEKRIQSLNLSFLEFDEPDDEYDYDDSESSFEKAQNLFTLSDETLEKLGRYDGKFVMPLSYVKVYLANQIADYADARIRSVEETEAAAESFTMRITLRDDTVLEATATYTGLIVEWK